MTLSHMQISKSLRFLVLAGAAMTMGIAMPSCPGQQAMQQQIDSLTAGNAESSRKIQALDTQIKTANTDLANLKQLSEQMATQITAQKAAIDQLTSAMKDMDAKVQALATKPAPHKTPYKAPSHSTGTRHR